MNIYRIRFEDSTEFERVYAEETLEVIREWFDAEISQGWVEGANGTYVIEDMGIYIPVEGE